jgi:hypothetical protein
LARNNRLRSNQEGNTMSAPTRSKSLKEAQPASVLDALPGLSNEGTENIKAMMSYKGSPTWEGIKVVPPGSFLEDVIELFRRETDIPLELPLMAALSHVSGTWTVVLAPSGSGKSFASSTVGRWLSDADGKPAVPHIMNASSAAKFVANIEDTPKGLWLRDEFGQFLSQVQNLQHMEEMKDILLRAYSGDVIERRTKETQIEVHDHALSILGITVGDTFERQIGADSLVDGFAQRFNYLQAEADPDRPMSDFPIYFEDMGKQENQVPFQRMRKAWLHLIGRNDLPDAIFTFEPDALQLFKDSFRSLFGEANIPGSFFRRSMFSVFSYAVLFHVIAGKMGTRIGQDSVSLAVRMVALHLDHARRLLDGYGLSQLEKVIRKAETLRDKRQSQSIPLKPRDLISNIREIKTAAQAHSILGLI